MDPNSGAHGRSGFTGHQATNNGAQGQHSFMPQQEANVNGINPAMRTHNNFYGPRPIDLSAMQTPQAHQRGQPGYTSQQLVHRNGNGNGMNQTMPIHNRQGTPAHHAPGNGQLVQNRSRARPGLVGPQMISNGNDLAMALATDPTAMAGFSQLCNNFLQQRVQNWNSQSPQDHQSVQYHQNHQNHQVQPYQQVQQYQQYQHDHASPQNGGEFNAAATPTGGENNRIIDLTQNTHENTNLPANLDASPAGYPNHLVAGTPPDAGGAEPVQPALVIELSETFQTEVNGLVEDKSGTFGDHIHSDADLARYEKAIWMAKWKGGKLEDKCSDYPEDKAERSRIARRIFDAFVNTQGEQDPATDAAENGNCLAVRAIQKLSGIEIEILVRKLMVSTAGTY